MPPISRRHFLAATGIIAAAPSVAAQTSFRSVATMASPLSMRALAALHRHADAIPHHDVIGIADFSSPSRLPRFAIVNLTSGQTERLLVAHGRGSDPDHSGWLHNFSNVPGSAATSAGAYLTGESYSGSHGMSRRLTGLDPENSNAESRAIVIHGAWYANPGVIEEQGKLGRSEGCFAFSETDISTVLDRLGPGRLIYAGKV